MACWRFYCFLIFSVRSPVFIAMSSPCFEALAFLSYFATSCMLNTPQEHTFSILSCSFFQILTTHIIYKFSNWLVIFCQVLFASYRTIWFALFCFLARTTFPHALTSLFSLSLAQKSSVSLSLSHWHPCTWLEESPRGGSVPCAISLLRGQIWKRRRQPLNATWNPELPLQFWFLQLHCHTIKYDCLSKTLSRKE